MTADTVAWSGRLVAEARALVAARDLPGPCYRCGRLVTEDHAWHVDHKIPKDERPDLIADPDNWAPSHQKCNTRHGQSISAAKRRQPIFSTQPTAAPATISAPSLPGEPLEPLPGLTRADLDPEGLHLSRARLRTVAAESPGLTFTEPDTTGMWPEDARTFWDLPECDQATTTWPRFMTAMHPDAVDTRGWEFIAWCEQHPDFHNRRFTGWRWWQILVALRACEIDANGRFVWSVIGLTLSRQLGKSWLLRALIMWRIHQTELFGEEQSVLHVAHKLAAAQEIWRPASRWAERRKQLGYSIRRTNGEQAIETPEGSRWLIAAATDSAGPAFSLSMSLADEAWRIPETVFDDAILPTHAEAEQPQAWLVSTAGDGKSQLMLRYRTSAFQQLRAPRSLLWIEWSAAPGTDILDEAGWRAASPHWDDRRRATVSEKAHTAAESGKPSAILAFRRQWLNQWVPDADVEEFTPWIPDTLVAHVLTAKTPGHDDVPGPGVRRFAALESTPDGASYAAAIAAKTGDTVVVASRQLPNMLDAARWLQTFNPEKVIAHESMRHRLNVVPELAAKFEKFTEADNAAATAVLADLVHMNSGRLISSSIDRQFGDAVTRVAAGGEVLDLRKSRGPVHELKAAALAAHAAHTARSGYAFA